MTRWIELGAKPRRRPGDVVTFSSAAQQGLTLSLGRQALDVLGLEIGAGVSVTVDPDPASPRLRIRPNADGLFRLSKPPNGRGDIAMLRLGHQPDIADIGLRRPIARVEWSDIGGALEIDLPTGLRAAATTSVVRDRGPPSSSTSTPKQAITLPRLRSLETADEGDGMPEAGLGRRRRQ